MGEAFLPYLDELVKVIHILLRLEPPPAQHQERGVPNDDSLVRETVRALSNQSRLWL